jgi:hypothetical protein
MNESELKSEAAPVAGNGPVDGTRTDYRRIVDSVPGSILVADAVVESSVGEDSARPSLRLGISGKGLQGRAGSLRTASRHSHDGDRLSGLAKGIVILNRVPVSHLPSR